MAIFLVTSPQRHQLHVAARTEDRHRFLEKVNETVVSKRIFVHIDEVG